MGLQVGLIGLGLIGGSLGLAFRESPLVDKINGYDLDPETVKQAVDIGVIENAGGLEDAIRGADVVFICVPLKAMPDLIKEISPLLKPGCIVTDVGSVKHPVGQWLSELPESVYTVGGHPMAGSEKAGIKSADRYMFENALYALTPFGEVPLDVMEKLVRLLQETGARVKVLDAAVHDRSVAMISHLPHVLAYALLGLVEGSPECGLMAAGSFRDLTRVAASNRQLWEDILLSNRFEVAGAIERLIEKLASFKRDLDTGDRDLLGNWILIAQKVREGIPRLQKGLLPQSHEIITVVPDRPGVIGQLGQWLGDKGINIVDIEILRVREGEGGTIRLGVPSSDDAVQAVEVLRQQDIQAWRR